MTSFLATIAYGSVSQWERLAESGQLGALKRQAYRQAMDTLREKEVLEDLAERKRAVEEM